RVSLDVLYRARWPDSLHRQTGEGGDVGRRRRGKTERAPDSNALKKLHHGPFDSLASGFAQGRPERLRTRWSRRAGFELLVCRRRLRPFAGDLLRGDIEAIPD